MLTATEKTVREVATETPSSIRVFESLGIDYCCGGKRTLDEACSRAGIDRANLTALLEKAEQDSQVLPTDGWSRKSLTALVTHIVETHHAYVRRETPRIEMFLSKVVAKHGPNHPEVVQIEPLFNAIAIELSAHMAKEERLLFPHIVRLEQAAADRTPPPPAFFGPVANPIANMMAEHEDAGALLTRIRDLSNGFVPPPSVCPTFIGLYRGLEEFEQDLHRHIHLENNILFPRAIALDAATHSGS